MGEFRPVETVVMFLLDTLSCLSVCATLVSNSPTSIRATIKGFGEDNAFSLGFSAFSAMRYHGAGFASGVKALGVSVR